MIPVFKWKHSPNVQYTTRGEGWQKGLFEIILPLKAMWMYSKTQGDLIFPPLLISAVWEKNIVKYCESEGGVVQVGWPAPWHRFKHVAISSARSPTTTCRIFLYKYNVSHAIPGWIWTAKQMNFRKSSQGGGGLSQSKKLCRRFWSFKEGFKLFFFRIKRCKMIFWSIIALPWHSQKCLLAKPNKLLKFWQIFHFW